MIKPKINQSQGMKNNKPISDDWEDRLKKPSSHAKSNNKPKQIKTPFRERLESTIKNQNQILLTLKSSDNSVRETEWERGGMDGMI